MKNKSAKISTDQLFFSHTWNFLNVYLVKQVGRRRCVMDEEIKCCKYCIHFNRAVNHCNENNIDIKHPYFNWCFNYESVK